MSTKNLVRFCFISGTTKNFLKIVWAKFGLWKANTAIKFCIFRTTVVYNFEDFLIFQNSKALDQQREENWTITPELFRQFLNFKELKVIALCWSSYNFASITVFQSLKNSWEVTTTFCFNEERKCKLYLTSAVSMYQLGKVQNSNSAKYNLTERNETIPFLIIVAFKLYTCWYFPSSYLDSGFCLLKWVFAVVSYKRGGAKKGFWGRVLKVEMGFEFTFGPLITQYFNLFSVLNPCSTATTLPLFSGLLIHTSLSVLSTLSRKQQRKNSVKNCLFSSKLKGLNDACDFLRRQLSSISLRVKYLLWNLLKPSSTFFGSKLFFDGHKHVVLFFSHYQRIHILCM